MPEAIWKKKPKLTPAQVKKLFGPNAALAQAGSGQWVIKDTKNGGRIRQPLSQQGGSAPTPGGGQPGPQPPQAPQAPAPPPPRESAAIAAALRDVGRQIDATPGLFNEQRRQSGLNFQRGLLDSGFFDTLNLGEREDGGNKRFTLDGNEGRLGGQLFRDTDQSIREGANRRGTFFSSRRRSNQQQANRDLMNQREAVMRDFEQGQDRSLQDQIDALAALEGRREELRGQQNDFRAGQAVPNPASMPDPQPGEPGGPTIEEPRRFIQLGPKRTREQAQTLGVREFGEGGFRVTQPGRRGLGLRITRL